jgi:hypothetical protein
LVSLMCGKYLGGGGEGGNNQQCENPGAARVS